MCATVWMFYWFLCFIVVLMHLSVVMYDVHHK